MVARRRSPRMTEIAFLRRIAQGISSGTASPRQTAAGRKLSALETPIHDGRGRGGVVGGAAASAAAIAAASTGRGRRGVEGQRAGGRIPLVVVVGRSDFLLKTRSAFQDLLYRVVVFVGAIEAAAAGRSGMAAAVAATASILLLLLLLLSLLFELKMALNRVRSEGG